MKKQTNFLCRLIVCIALFQVSTVYTVAAQTPTLKGHVIDTLSKMNMHNAVVYIKSTKDSSLVSFARADQKGAFTLKATVPGNYIMVVSYPNYVDWIDTVNVTAGASPDLKVILSTKEHILQEVIVRQTIAPVRIKGDTTEYMADSFHVRPGATVEDLLKIMPGISVDSKGVITTQGQTVRKVLVDGDDFFGDDPTMATKNLNAKDVAKVQVFDKKSDQAALTGIDDGSKEKTVNLILKEDAKKGYFGKVEGGTDFNKYYSGKISANRFTSTLKMGALIIADRTGNSDLSWQEEQDYGGITANVDASGNASYSWDGDNEFSSWNRQGIPESFMGAGMLNKKFGKLKSNTINNYTYNHLNLSGESNTNTKYILPDTTYYSNQNSSFTGSKWRHSFNTKNEFNLDSLTTLTVNAKGTYGKSANYGLTNSEYLTAARVPVNTSERVNTSNTDKDMQKADIFFRRKLNRTGTRSFTLSTGISRASNNSEGFVINKTSFYSGGSLASVQTIDQRKIGSNETKNMQALASYAEPLGKKMSVNINYTFNSSNNVQETRSYDKSNGKYDSLNLLYSNSYKFINTSHRGGVVWNLNTKKITARVGLAVQELELKQTNLIKDSSVTRKFTNFFPNANATWKFTSSGSLRLYYSGSTQQPSLMQIQPILNNNDPLNVVIGNPELRPAFNHYLNLNIGDYKVLSSRDISLYANMNLMQNAFSSKSIVDSLGRRITQTVNVNGNYSYYISAGYGLKTKIWKDLSFRIGPQIDGNRYMSFVNGQQNITNSYTLSPYISFNKYKEKKGSFYVSYRPSFSHSTSSINKDAVTEYWTQRLYVSGDYRFKGGFLIRTEINANYRQKLNPDDRNNNAFVWDMYVEKKIIKKQDITLILSVSDLLNQKRGFERNISSNYVTENTYTTVQRYAMLSLRWKFNKNRKADEDD